MPVPSQKQVSPAVVVERDRCGSSRLVGCEAKRAIRVSTRSLLLGARAPLSQVDSAAGPTRAAVACLGVAGRHGF